MNKRQLDQRGSVAAVVSIVLLSISLVGAVAFAFWAYSGRQDYKYNSDKKVAAAVKENTKKIQAEDAKAFAIEAEKPLKVYRGPEAYGSVMVSIPKTWSVYVPATNASVPFNFFAHPDVVPDVADKNSRFALRISVLSQKYDTVLKTFNGQLQKGKVTIKPYSLPENPEEIGSRIDGELKENQRGSVILMPVRDKTLKIWTESEEYLRQFEEYVLTSAKFVP